MFPFHATPPTAIPRLRQTGSEFLRLGRTVYFDACSSLFAYCTERLGYSEDSATKRVRVARLAQQFPQVLDDLASGELHLTGLFLLSGHLTDDNAEQLLAEARGKSKRQLEELLARWFPRPAVPPTITPVTPEPVQGQLSTWSGAGTPAPPPAQAPRPRVEPLSPESVRVEFSAHAAFRDKLEQARALLSHTVPSGDLATILERALDLLIERETKRRAGAGKPRKRRETKPGSRHVPVEVQRAVRERDGDQCTFTDAEGRRCSANRQSGRAGGAPSPDANGREALTRGKTLNATEFLTIEHIDPFAKGGPTTVDNCCLLCRPHNAHRARQVFGEDHIQNEISEARARRRQSTPPAPPAPTPAPEGGVSEKVLGALVRMGFKRADARRAVEQARLCEVEPLLEPMLRATLAILTP